MKHLSSFYQSRKQYQSEVITNEITDWHSNINLPRHISAPTTQCHRGTNLFNKIQYVPRVCRLDTFKDSKNSTMALDILKYQLKDRTSQEKHFKNIRANLERRLQVAKSQGNKRLVNILQDEYKQISNSL